MLEPNKEATTWNIGVRLLPWYWVIRFLTSVDCKSALVEFCSVCDYYAIVGISSDSRGVRVCNLISSLDITVSGLYSISPDPLNPPYAFC